MAQEEKELLLKDLSARLLYGIIIQVYYEDIAGSGCYDETVWMVDNDKPFHINDKCIEDIKPYLRPMSSMDEEEEKEFENLLEGIVDGIERWDKPDMCEEYDWLNSHHFDYRGLIEKGLALEAPKDMYKEE